MADISSFPSFADFFFLFRVIAAIIQSDKSTDPSQIFTQRIEREWRRDLALNTQVKCVLTLAALLQSSIWIVSAQRSKDGLSS